MPEKLLKSAFSFSSMTMISRVAGLVRDVVFATFFGAGMAMDAFFVAFKLPNFLRRLFAEGAFSQAFIPVLSEYKEQRQSADVRELVAAVIGTLGTILLLLTLLGLVLLPLLFEWAGLAWFEGVEQQKYLLAAELIVWTFPYIFFISLTALVAGVLNTYRQFALPAFTPVLLNLVLIGGAVGFHSYFEQPVMAIGIAVFVAGVVQLLFLLPALARLGLLAVPIWGWAKEGVRRIIRLMLPAIFGASVVQINLLIDTLIAFLLVSGSVSWLYYSDRLVEFPLGVFGIALSTVILPGLSQRFARKAHEEFSQLMDWGLRWGLFITMPAMTGLLVLAAPLVTTLFAYDAFTQRDVAMSSLALVGYAVGLPAFVLVKILAPGFFARQDTRTPVKAAVVAMVTNVSMNILLVGGLLWLSFDGVHVGLAIATSLGAYVNAGLLFYWLKSSGVYRPSPGWWRLLLQVGLASLAMGLVLMFMSAPADIWYQRQLPGRLLWLMIWVIAGMVVYAIIVGLLGLRPAQLKQPKPRESGGG